MTCSVVTSVYVHTFVAMIYKIRNANITGDAVNLVIDKKAELEKKGTIPPINRGVAVNALLNEYAELLKKNKKQ
jgi:multisubunit Na+/H+ antiporter MnhC subunit